MSSDRGGLLKARAESFARHLQTRLRTLSESQDDAVAWSEGADAEVYYDIESPLASPDEEAVEPVFIAAQNIDSLRGLERTDSEASTYYDTLENVEELKTLSPVGLFNTRTKTTIENGFVDFLDNNKSIDNFEISSILKLKNENVICNKDSFSDAGSSGTFDSLRLQLEVSDEKTEVCDRNALEENNNIGKYLEEVTDFILGLENNNCDLVEVDTRQSEEDTSRSEPSEETVNRSKDMYCVFCDIEQIKTGLTSDHSEVCEIDRTSRDSEANCSQHNGFLEEDVSIPLTETSEEDKYTTVTDHECDQDINGQEMPRIIVEKPSDCFDSNENSSLSNALQELKIEIIEDSLSDKSKIEGKHTARLEDLNGFTAKEPSAVLGATNKGDEVDEFDFATKRKHFQRSSSLKSGKTPPGTPGRKKIVRFADVLGLDLADVKTFLDEVPTVPKSAYEDLHGVDLTMELVTEPLSNHSFTVVAPQVEKVLTPLFQQPCFQPNFLDRIRQHNVCLENAIVSDMSLFAISGLVRVKNMDFHKSVHVRYTINGWRSFSDLQARYIPNSCDGFSDKFSFTLYAHTLSVGQRLEFAVRFQTAGEQFWDNNCGINYVFACNSLQPALSSSSSLTVNHDDETAAFY